MSSSAPLQTQSGKIENSWFELDAHKQAVHQDKFLSGLEILANTSGNDYLLIDHLFRQLETADLPNWPEAHRVKGAALKLSKEWPRVAIGNQAVRLHRTALEQISPKFKAQLKAGMQETEYNCITLEAPDEIALPALNYLRTGEIVIDGNNVMELLEFACHHLLDDLRCSCEDDIEKNLSWSTFSDSLDLARYLNLPSLLCKCLCFAQNNEDQAACQLTPEKKKLATLASRCSGECITLFLSPEGQPAISSSFKSPDSIDFLKEINSVVSIKCLVMDYSIPFPEGFKKLASALPDLEELTIRVGISPTHLPALREIFPKLRSFGSMAPIFKTFAAVKEYLTHFAPPGQEAAALGPFRLRALNLGLIKGLTQEQISALFPYFGDLYHLCLRTEKIIELDLPKAASIHCPQCPALTKLSAPKALTIISTGCKALTTLWAPNATEIDCTDCSALTNLWFPKALRVRADSCSVLTTLWAPNATEVLCDFSSSLAILSAPKAKLLSCQWCPSLTSLWLPSAGDVRCQKASALKSLWAPKLTHIDCSGCDALADISWETATHICCSDCKAFTTLSAPNAISIMCHQCPELTTLAAPKAEYVQCSCCPALTSIWAPSATRLDCAQCSRLTTIWAPNAAYNED